MTELCCPEHGIHQWLLGAARTLSFQDLDDQEIFDRLQVLTTNVRRNVPDREINDSIAKVRGTDSQAAGGQRLLKPRFEPETLARLASEVRTSVDSAYLARRSKFTPHNRSPAGFLHKLYRPGEKIIVFDVLESQGCHLWEHPGLGGDFSTLDYLSRGRFGVWYLCNPVDGEAHWNPREGKWSWRSEEAITSFRYAVIESDEADPGLWLAAVVQLPLPIAAIYSSGKRSIQVLARVDADSKNQWDKIVRREWAPILVRLGADYGALSGVRLSRLPGCWRGETGKLQELLYLDDEPDETPIIDKPLRDPDTLRATRASNL
jgi:hypothetical protein